MIHDRVILREFLKKKKSDYKEEWINLLDAELIGNDNFEQITGRVEESEKISSQICYHIASE